MVCQKCSYEFCWDCLGYYPNYTHKEDTKCPLRKFLLTPILVILATMINLKLIQSSIVYSEILKFSMIFITKLVIVFLLLICLIIEYLIVDKFQRMRRVNYCYQRKEYWLIVVMTIIYPIFWYVMIVFLNRRLGLAAFLYSILTFIIMVAIAFAVLKILMMIFKKIRKHHSVKRLLFL